MTGVLISASCLFHFSLCPGSSSVSSILLYHIKTSQSKVHRTAASGVGRLGIVGHVTWWSGQVLALTLVSVPWAFQVPLHLTLSPPGVQPPPRRRLYPFSLSISVGQIMLLLSLISMRSMISQRLMTCRDRIPRGFRQITYK